MAEIDEIVRVTITRQTSVPSMASFSEHLIADMFNPVGIKPVFDKTHRIRIFASAAEIATAGFSTDSWVYKCAARQFSQSPHITKIYVGWKCPGGIYDIRAMLDKPFVSGNIIHWIFGGVTMPDISFDEEGSSEAMVDTLVKAVNDEELGVMAIKESALVVRFYGARLASTIDIEGGATQPTITWSGDTEPIAADSGWTEALNAMLADGNNGFYACEANVTAMADQQEFALWVQANEKLGGIVSNDSAIVDEDGGDIAEWLKTDNIDRVFCFYHPDDPYFISGLFGKLLTKHPGTATWAHKRLESTATITLSAGQRDKAFGKNANIYTSVSDMPITRWGTTGSGEYIDVIHGTDWLKAKIQQLVLTPLVQQDKVPYEDDGIETIVSQLRAGLEQGVTYKILKGGNVYTITHPTVDEVDADAKAERLLPAVAFNAPLSGAIHKTVITGVVTL